MILSILRQDFAQRKPWTAAVVSLVAGPFAGMLYVSRAGLALAWLAASLPVITALWVVLAPLMRTPDDALLTAAALFNLAGALHARRAARQGDGKVAWYGHWHVVMGALLLLVLGGAAFQARVLAFYETSAGAMAPALYNGDRFIAYRMAYKERESWQTQNMNGPQRGDIVIYARSMADKDISVARVVGMPGETVAIEDGFVSINGQVLSYEKNDSVFCPPADATCPEPNPSAKYVENTPEGASYRVALVSDAKTVYEVPQDQYFLMGDNRPAAIDSRFRQVGFVPAKKIQGKVVALYWDATARRMVFRKTGGRN